MSYEHPAPVQKGSASKRTKVKNRMQGGIQSETTSVKTSKK